MSIVNTACRVSNASIKMRCIAAMFDLTFIILILMESWIVPHSQSGMYYVVSENCNATDNDKHQESECHPLASYMCNETECPFQYFNSYETYMFGNGVHFPANRTITIMNVTNLTFIGPTSGSAVIDCKKESIGFVFTWSSNITFENLKFSACVRKYSTTTGDHALATLAFMNGMNLALTRVTLLNSVDEAVYVHDILGIMHFKEIVIDGANSDKNSLINVIFNSKCNSENLEITIEDSMFINNIINVPINESHNNENLDPDLLSQPVAAGLSIILKCLSVNVKLHNITMRNNSGIKGGNLGSYFTTLPAL